MSISKFVLNGVTQMDVTDTTATAEDVASGKYFYNSAGIKTAGTSSGGGAASDILVVSVLYDSTTPSNPSHTYAEMLDAYNNGKFIVCKYLQMPEEYGKQAEFLPLKSYYDSSNVFTFNVLFIDSTSIKEYRITCNSSNVWTYAHRTI